MRTIEEVTYDIISRFRNIGAAQVSGYNTFTYTRETDNAILIKRESGTEARIPIDKIRTAVEAVRSNPQVYNGGPSGLANYGITHINSPIWAMLHLLTIQEILE
jgi:hypothetical protein